MLTGWAGQSLDRLDSSQDSQLNIEASAAASHESYSIHFETWTASRAVFPGAYTSAFTTHRQNWTFQLPRGWGPDS
jgi:hypothetical protein